MNGFATVSPYEPFDTAKPQEVVSPPGLMDPALVEKLGGKSGQCPRRRGNVTAVLHGRRDKFGTGSFFKQERGNIHPFPVQGRAGKCPGVNGRQTVIFCSFRYQCDSEPQFHRPITRLVVILGHGCINLGNSQPTPAPMEFPPTGIDRDPGRINRNIIILRIRDGLFVNRKTGADCVCRVIIGRAAIPAFPPFNGTSVGIFKTLPGIAEIGPV